MKFRYPEREVIVEHGDLEIELEVPMNELLRIESVVRKHNNCPLLKLILTAKGVDGQVTLGFNNLDLP